MREKSDRVLGYMYYIAAVLHGHVCNIISFWCPKQLLTHTSLKYIVHVIINVKLVAQLKGKQIETKISDVAYIYRYNGLQFNVWTVSLCVRCPQVLLHTSLQSPTTFAYGPSTIWSCNCTQGLCGSCSDYFHGELICITSVCISDMLKNMPLRGYLQVEPAITGFLFCLAHKLV